MGLKKAYQEEIETQLSKWDSETQQYLARINDLQRKAEKLENRDKAECMQQLQLLEDRVTAVRAKLEAGKQQYETVKTATDEAWEDMKVGLEEAWSNIRSGVENGWNSLQEGLDNATSRLR